MAKKLGIVLKSGSGHIVKKVYEADVADSIFQPKVSAGQLANLNADLSTFLTAHQDISGKLDVSTYDTDKLTYQTKTDNTISGTEKNLITIINKLLGDVKTATSTIATLQSSLNAVGITHIVADTSELSTLTSTAVKGEMALQVDDKTLHIFDGTNFIKLADNVGASVDITTKQNVTIADANNHFTGTTVESVLDELYTLAHGKQNALTSAQLAVANGDKFVKTDYLDKSTSEGKFALKTDIHKPTFVGTKTESQIGTEYTAGTVQAGDWYEEV